MPNYKIKKGDTLSAIAKKEGTTVSKLMSLNPQIKDKNMIMSGVNLNLPYGMEKLESNVKSAPAKQAVARMNQTQTGIKAMAAQGAAMVANKKNEALTKMSTGRNISRQSISKDANKEFIKSMGIGTKTKAKAKPVAGKRTYYGAGNPSNKGLKK